jgi:hypothetical protein
MCKTSDSCFVIGARSASNNGMVTGNHGGVDDYWVFKIDQAGVLKWQKCFGGNYPETTRGLWPTTDGGFIVSGISRSTDGDVANGSHNGKYWTIKIDSVGNLLHQDTGLAIFSVKPVRSGDYIAAGLCDSANFWIAKLDTSLHIVWRQSYGGNRFDTAKDIIQTLDGGFMAVGVTNSKDGDISDYDGSKGTVGWIIKTDSLGSVQWKKTVKNGLPVKIIQLKDSSFVLAGNTSELTNAPAHQKSQDYWLMKMTASGDSIWEQVYGGTGLDILQSMEPYTQSGFLLSGQTWAHGGDVTYFHGTADAWVVAVDSSGHLIWQRCLGGSVYDGAYSALQTSDGGVMVAAFTVSTDFEVTESLGGTDVWMVKLNFKTGIPEIQNQPLFQVFPNPASKMLTVVLNKMNGTHQAEFRDVFGRAVLAYQLHERSTEISIDNLSPGTYFLSVTDVAGVRIITKI